MYECIIFTQYSGIQPITFQGSSSRRLSLAFFAAAAVVAAVGVPHTYFCFDLFCFSSGIYFVLPVEYEVPLASTNAEIIAYSANSSIPHSP